MIDDDIKLVYGKYESKEPREYICALTVDLINQKNKEIDRLTDKLQRANVAISKHSEAAEDYKNDAIDRFAYALKIEFDEMVDKLVNEIKGGDEDDR